ncbi:MAG: hypothetical protein IMZ44_24785 [Planctomycetes bacterium]|nr:hypothetical protein [Planctomycetota bacterium]
MTDLLATDDRDARLHAAVEDVLLNGGWESPPKSADEALGLIAMAAHDLMGCRRDPGIAAVALRQIVVAAAWVIQLRSMAALACSERDARWVYLHPLIESADLNGDDDPRSFAEAVGQIGACVVSLAAASPWPFNDDPDPFVPVGACALRALADLEGMPGRRAAAAAARSKEVPA